MARRNKILDDPVVAEVRAARQRIWKEAGGTIAGLLDWLDAHVPKVGQRSSRRVSKNGAAKARQVGKRSKPLRTRQRPRMHREFGESR